MSKISTLEKKVAERISRKKSTVIMRADLEGLGGYDQIGRALRMLVAKGKIVKIGYGLYAKTTVSVVSGKRVPQKPLPSLAKEALKRLGVETAPSSLEKEYSAGRTTQVPTGRVIAVRGRINRKIGYNGTFVVYEHISK
ncbi:MAG: hypothetical protein L6Q97_07095 [Thermoanaerobaculia bacterium]|nr:hypothetical protein [Thermoanaerobaculia bacterium]